MNWFPIPFVRICIPFISGIIFCASSNYKIPFALYLLGFSIIISGAAAEYRFNYGNRWLFGIPLNITLFLLGYVTCFHHDDRNSTEFFGHQLYDQKIMMQGVITGVPVYKNWIKVELSIKYLKTDSTWKTCSGKLLTYIKSDSNSQSLKYGDLIFLHTNPISVAEPKNPNAFNFKHFLKYQNIHYQTFVQNDDWQLIACEKGNPILRASDQLRTKFLATLRKHIKGEKEYAVGAALILGYKNNLSDDIKEAYSETGSIHVLAVSGLHVGIIYLFLSFIIKSNYLDNRFIKYSKLTIILSAIWAYALLTGSSPSVLRAATMFSFFIFGKYSHKISNVYNLLAASAFFLLLLNPFLIFQVGFQLSYAAVIGIVYFQPKLRILYTTMNNVIYHIWELTTVSIAAQITVLPLSLFYFHQFPLYFWLTGFIVVDAAWIILLLGILLFFAEILLPTLAVYIGILLEQVLWLVNFIIINVQKLPYGLIENVWIGLGSAVLLYFIIWELARFWEEKKLYRVIWATTFGLFLSGIYAFQQFENHHKKQIVVYNIDKENTVIDFIFGQEIISFSSENISNKLLKYNVENNRNKLKINNIIDINIDYTENFETKNLIWEKPFIQFFDQRIAVLDKPVKSDIPLIKTNLVLLRNNPKIKIETLSQVFDFENLAIDVSNNFRSTNEWKKTCEEKNIPIYDIRSSGALVIDLE